MTRRPAHALDQSALYKITSPTMLAARLCIGLDELEALLSRTDNYSLRFEKKKSSGGLRKIEEPKSRLQGLHGRIHNLLCRVALPDYVHSVRKGWSYVSNARAHLGGGELVKVDVEKFYPSVARGAIAAFFHQDMQCARDVAGLLAHMVTFDGHLPTGSKSSPILSYFVHRAMFDQIATLAAANGLRMTLYVDDMTISGPGAGRGIMRGVRDIISAHGLRSHKLKAFGSRPAKIVTGVVVAADGLRLPNRRHARIGGLYAELHAAQSEDGKLKVIDRLGSALHEAAQIEPRLKPSAVQIDALRLRLRAG